MAIATYRLHQNPGHDVEIILHVDETPGKSRRGDLVDALAEIGRIRSAEFCPLPYHLMLVNHDREKLGSQEVLTGIVSQNIHAQLIGPVWNISNCAGNPRRGPYFPSTHFHCMTG